MPPEYSVYRFAGSRHPLQQAGRYVPVNETNKRVVSAHLIVSPRNAASSLLG